MKWLVMFVILELGLISAEIAMVLDAYIHQVHKQVEEDFDGDDHDRIYQARAPIRGPSLYCGLPEVPGAVEHGAQAVLGCGGRSRAASRAVH